MTGRGRPSKFSAEKQKQIVQAIELGNYIETAAAYAGINKSTLYEWLKRGQREIDRVERLMEKNPEKDFEDLVDPEEVEYIHFSNAVERALAKAEFRDVATITQAAQGGKEMTEVTIKMEKYVDADGNIHEREIERSERTKKAMPSWQAAAWKLERRDPERWGRRRVELTGADGAPLQGEGNVHIYLPDNGRKLIKDEPGDTDTDDATETGE